MNPINEITNATNKKIDISSSANDFAKIYMSNPNIATTLTKNIVVIGSVL